jgi:hypothetical protein
MSTRHHGHAKIEQRNSRPIRLDEARSRRHDLIGRAMSRTRSGAQSADQTRRRLLGAAERLVLSEA